MSDLPAGWGALEQAEAWAREALAAWENPDSTDNTRLGAELAVAMRQLLKELEAERKARQP